MKKVITYLILVLGLQILAIRYRTEIATFLNLQYSSEFRSVFFTSWSAMLGSIFYCLRAVYENKCVHKNWDKDWEVWYYLRPLTAVMIGIGVWLALKAGVFVLAKDANSVNIWSSCFVGFVAGMNIKNMQRFLEKLVKKKIGLKESNQTKQG